MASHFRTITAVVQIDDDSDLRGPGYAVETARRGLESSGFTVLRIRNEHNYSGEQLPEDEHNAPIIGDASYAATDGEMARAALDAALAKRGGAR
ncbi:hypothetical protein [Actinoplanes teichomyceticus]|uniref:Uncharacterized protein n=1 Tax=Actinoplanes teichomyceticus TaxID=1867 RepID=A0A561WAW5_ACTTI|nr:hypothetical protein [Actinoplanes teichomyceticus]TWG21006.1 hypothetical protein FHX34_103535 [Actinoplanes teichomyceticus]GIF14827.1 hypothetical protein Ate01nite_48590 [Actinoplanes teichomyceticus]